MFATVYKEAPVAFIDDALVRIGPESGLIVRLLPPPVFTESYGGSWLRASWAWVSASQGTERGTTIRRESSIAESSANTVKSKAALRKFTGAGRTRVRPYHGPPMVAQLKP